MENSKIVVAHPAQQHSYRTAIGLKKSNLLGMYLTTVYKKTNSITNILSVIFGENFRHQTLKKCCPELVDEDVKLFVEFGGLFKLACLHNKNLKNMYISCKYFVADCFAKKASKFAIKYKAKAIITYDDCSPLLFKIIKKNSPNTIRILDVSAANLLYMKHIYEEDMKLSPEFADKLYEERKILWNDKRMSKAKDEIELSQYFLVGSNFVKKSLMFSGVKEDKIYVCPYGVDVDKFSFIPRKIKEKKESLQIIFVGGTKQLKGISYLLDAFLEIPKDIAQLTIIGVNNLSENLYAKYKDKINFLGQLSHDAVAQELSKADIMVFPSLGDGFGLVIIEAMAVGLPVIGSINSGASDIIEDGTNGFVIPIQDKNAIINKVLWFNENRDKIPEMSHNARNTALLLTWEKYYENLSNAVKDISKREDAND